MHSFSLVNTPVPFNYKSHVRTLMAHDLIFLVQICTLWSFLNCVNDILCCGNNFSSAKFEKKIKILQAGLSNGISAFAIKYQGLSVWYPDPYF